MQTHALISGFDARNDFEDGLAHARMSGGGASFKTRKFFK